MPFVAVSWLAGGTRMTRYKLLCKGIFPHQSLLKTVIRFMHSIACLDWRRLA
jgi:hypothetical protein